ncbi:MAG: heme-binding protein [Haloferacaceae archaeon]
MAEAPPTDEGWFVLHDLRTVDWDAWRTTPERERERAVAEGTEFLTEAADLAAAGADEGHTLVTSVLGDGADLMLVHMRPSLDDLSALERRLESTELAGFLDRADSHVSVTEVSGYVSTEYFEGDEAETDAGTRQYMESKLHPDPPEDEYVSYYPMSKRREGADNWYTLSMEERAELMAEHGDTGRDYAGRIKQVIASSVGYDDHEWSVTLFGGDATDIKQIVYEMRFDEVSARYGEFEEFYVGRRFPPEDLDAYLAGERVPTSEFEAEDHHASDEAGSRQDGPDDVGRDRTSDEGTDEADADDIRGALADLDVYAGKPHGEDVCATVLYSEADPDEVADEVEGLRGNFEHYDTHVRTAVYEARGRDRSAVVSVWDTASAAETAAGFLSDLPGVVGRAGDEESGFGTMGMFYTVKPDHREEFTDRFDTVLDLLADTEGHHETDLMINVDDENDMFIASGWRAREDAMAFFRSDAFRDTVDWGREVLADRPRHVFLA